LLTPLFKAGATLQKKDFRGLQTLAALADKRWVHGIILYTGSEIIPFGKNLHALPISSLWQAAS
jgi:hypothetical protein